MKKQSNPPPPKGVRPKPPPPPPKLKSIGKTYIIHDNSSTPRLIGEFRDKDYMNEFISNYIKHGGHIKNIEIMIIPDNLEGKYILI